MITEIDNVLMELIGNNNEVVYIYGNDFENFPIVFDSFIKISNNAKNTVYNCFSKMCIVSNRTELISDKTILENLTEIDDELKRNKDRKNKIYFY